MSEPKRTITQLAVEFSTDGDENQSLTTNFTTMRIINSMRGCWPIFELYFFIDNQMFIEKNIYGVNDIVCKVYYTSDTGEKVEPPIEYRLLYLESRIELPPKEEVNGPWDNIKES